MPLPRLGTRSERLRTAPALFLVLAVVLAVAHAGLKALPISFYDGLFAPGPKVMLDVKGTLDRDALVAAGYDYWRL